MKCIAIITFFAATISAQDLSPAEILEKIHSHYLLMNDVAADFTQTVKMRYKKTGQHVSGTVKIKKGNKYRLQTEQQTIVTNGKIIWMYNPQSNQVLRDIFKQNRQSFSPDKFLLGLPKEFSAVAVEKDSQNFIVSLQSAKSGVSSSLVSALKIWVEPATWIFNKIEITDKNNTITTITLHNMNFNKGISDKEFQFEITSGMKIVDLTAIQ